MSEHIAMKPVLVGMRTYQRGERIPDGELTEAEWKRLAQAKAIRTVATDTDTDTDEDTGTGSDMDTCTDTAKAPEETAPKSAEAPKAARKKKGAQADEN